MAMPVQPLSIGVDVAKAELVLCSSSKPVVQTLSNTKAAIRSYFKRLPAPACFALEATNTFHLAFVELAHAAGHTVYLIDGYRLNRYRESVGGRAKTDATDAQLLRRYLLRERDALHPWSPPPAGYARLQRLLRRRAKLVEARGMLAQSLQGLPELQRAAAALLSRIERLEGLLDQRLATALAEAGWTADAARIDAIEGIGPLTAAALTTAFHRGAFRRSDAFIAFLGLDVRVRDSGSYRGRRKLTKQGDPQLRRLLYLAAMAAARSATWQPFLQRHLDRGLSKIQAYVALARKLARVAFALLKQQTDYRPKIPQEALT